MSGGVIRRADEMSSALRELHASLIRAEAGDDPAYANPYTLLFAVIGDPRFAWLEGFSQLIVDLDKARGDRKVPLEPSGLAASEAAARAYIGLGAEEDHPDPHFRLRHLTAMQASPEVALATGRVRRALEAGA